MSGDPTTGTPDFTRLPDLASRAIAGSVVAANDELFAERENLITPGRAVFSAESFGHKGKIYDGWETRRRREPGNDWAIVRLGVPGVVRGVDVDTQWFTGNYPPFASVEATSLPAAASTEDLVTADWVTLVEKSGLEGDSHNYFAVERLGRFTHVRLSIHPDGGVARFRVHGRRVPDPRLMTGTIDLAALELGGDVVDCSNMFYSSPLQLLQPGRARLMGDGWENARRRDEGNDHVTVKLCARGMVRRVELDTSYFVGNAPGWAKLSGVDAPTGELDDLGAWSELVPRTRLQPDTRHFFRVPRGSAVTHVRLDVYPDGGLARLRVHGEIDTEGLASATTAWWDLLPAAEALEVLTDEAGVPVERARELVDGRPLSRAGGLPQAVVQDVLGE